MCVCGSGVSSAAITLVEYACDWNLELVHVYFIMECFCYSALCVMKKRNTLHIHISFVFGTFTYIKWHHCKHFKHETFRKWSRLLICSAVRLATLYSVEHSLKNTITNHKKMRDAYIISGMHFTTDLYTLCRVLQIIIRHAFAER